MRQKAKPGLPVKTLFYNTFNRMISKKILNTSLIPIFALLLFALHPLDAQDSPGTRINPKEDKEKEELPESWVNPPPDQDAAFPVHPFVADNRAPLVSMGADGRLVYKSYSDKGDRIPDWSGCGYERNDVPIPDVPVTEILQPLSGNVLPSGNMRYPNGPDNREQIQSALDRVEARKPGADGSRGAVLLQKGTYYLDGTLKVPSGVVLRGEGDGEDGTVLIFNCQGRDDAIVVEGEGPVKDMDEGTAIRIAQDYLPTGSISLTIEDARQFKPGDFICIKKNSERKMD